MTLDALSSNEIIRKDYPVLAEAAGSVATPQIRNVGTIAGNIAQRPWCWYYRNGFPCYKNGGNQCFSFAGENQFHAIFGGGPSYIVHPSDTAPALVALGATFRIVGPGGERRVPASEFFVLPRQNAAAENVLADDEVLASIDMPAAKPGTKSHYYKVTRPRDVDACGRQRRRRPRDGPAGLPRRARRARRRGAHSVAAARGRADARRAARSPKISPRARRKPRSAAREPCRRTRTRFR